MLYKQFIKIFGFFAIFVGVSANFSHAQTKYEGIDTNNDHVITRDEWRAQSDRSFRNNDWNGDGVLSGNEVIPGATRFTQGTSLEKFNQLDINNDNQISRREWDSTEARFNNLDRNQNEVLSYAEYSGQTNQDRFDRLDRNDNGRISRSEWPYTSRAFSQLDLNNNENLSREEFFNRGDRSRTAVFRELDNNNDLLISRSEWRGSSDRFDRLDANYDNRITETEFYARETERTSLVDLIINEIFDRE